MYSLYETLLAFTLLHFVLQGQTCLLPHLSLDFLFLHSSPLMKRTPSSIPASRRSPGEGNGYPLQYSFLENPMERGTRWATVHGVAKSQTWLSNLTQTDRNTSWQQGGWDLLKCYLLLSLFILFSFWLWGWGKFRKPPEWMVRCEWDKTLKIYLSLISFTFKITSDWIDSV